MSPTRSSGNDASRPRSRPHGPAPAGPAPGRPAAGGELSARTHQVAHRSPHTSAARPFAISGGFWRRRLAGRGSSAAADATAPRASVVDEQSDVAPYRRILVPIKHGAIAAEMAATAILVADEYGATVEAFHVIRVPLDVDLGAAMAAAERDGEEALAGVRRLGEQFDVEVTATMTRARALGRAIVDQAATTGSDLIVLGSSPRWRRQSRFFSPTVDFVLRRASCEVVVVAFPQGTVDDLRARG